MKPGALLNKENRGKDGLFLDFKFYLDIAHFSATINVKCIKTN